MALFWICLATVFSPGAGVPLSSHGVDLDLNQRAPSQHNSGGSVFALSRAKRSNNDEEISLVFMGVNVGTFDPISMTAHQDNLKDLKKMIPSTQSGVVKVYSSYDWGSTEFNTSVDYQLNHSNEELGGVRLTRTKTDGTWKTNVAVVSKNDPIKKIIPVIDLMIETNDKTFFHGAFKRDGSEWKLNATKVTDELITAVFVENTRTHNQVEVHINKREETVEISCKEHKDEPKFIFRKKDKKMELVISQQSREHKIEYQWDTDTAASELRVSYKNVTLGTVHIEREKRNDQGSFTYKVKYMVDILGRVEGTLNVTTSRKDLDLRTLQMEVLIDSNSTTTPFSLFGRPQPITSNSKLNIITSIDKVNLETISINLGLVTDDIPVLSAELERSGNHLTSKIVSPKYLPNFLGTEQSVFHLYWMKQI
jgi:hypothetical protein